MCKYEIKENFVIENDPYDFGFMRIETQVHGNCNISDNINRYHPQIRNGI